MTLIEVLAVWGITLNERQAQQLLEEMMGADDFDLPTPRLTKEQAAVLSAFTGVMMGPFHEFHEYVEGIMGRPVYTHEFASDEMSKAIKSAAWDDFMEIVRTEVGDRR